jgi:predicted metal-dependent hydrolase
MPNFKFSAEQAKKIAAEIPTEMRVRRVISLLELAADDYHSLAQHRESRNSKGARTSFETIREAVTHARDLLAGTENDGSFWRGLDFQKLISSMDKISERALERIETHSLLIKEQSGRIDHNRDLLLERVMRIWLRIAQGKRAVSTSLQGKRGGPTIRFFVAALSPIMGTRTPSVESIRDFIRKKPRRLRKAIAKGELKSEKK